MENMIKKQMVLVSLIQYDDDQNRPISNVSMLLEIDELRKQEFDFACLRRKSNFLTEGEYLHLLADKKYILNWSFGGGNLDLYYRDNTFTFSVIEVFVCDDKVLFQLEDVHNMGNLKSKADRDNPIVTHPKE